MRPFVPDPPPLGMSPEHAEWITRQLRRITDTGRLAGEAVEQNVIDIGDNAADIAANTARIVTLEQHPPRVDNPHQTSWDNLLAKPSCPVNWIGAYAGLPSKRCDMTLDGAWTMIANKDTEDRPAPQPTGAPFWVSDLPGSPVWSLLSATSSSLIVGQRYTWDVSGWLTLMRFDRAEAVPTVDHELWVVTDPLGTPDTTRIFGPIVPNETGWVEIPQGQIFVVPGETFDVFLFSGALDAPTSWTAEYDYKRQNGDPDEKEIAHQSAGGGNEMRVHHIDEQSNDRQSALEALVPGDEISGGGIDWTITSVDHWLDHVRFGVTPASRASEGKYIFTFTGYAPAPIAYNRADAHFLGEPRVRGFYSENGYQNIVLDDHGYGVDIHVQPAAISDDWDLVSSIS